MGYCRSLALVGYLIIWWTPVGLSVYLSRETGLTRMRARQRSVKRPAAPSNTFDSLLPSFSSINGLHTLPCLAHPCVQLSTINSVDLHLIAIEIGAR
jgi:hypothetical protein